MDTAKTLLDKAQKIGFTRYAIHKRTGIPQSTLSKLEHGSHHGSPAIAARLAALVNEDPAQAALAVIAEDESSEDKRKELARLFKLAPAAAVLAVTVLLGATQTAEAASTAALTRADSSGPLCIMSTNWCDGCAQAQAANAGRVIPQLFQVISQHRAPSEHPGTWSGFSQLAPCHSLRPWNRFLTSTSTRTSPSTYPRMSMTSGWIREPSRPSCRIECGSTSPLSKDAA